MKKATLVIGLVLLLGTYTPTMAQTRSPERLLAAVLGMDTVSDPTPAAFNARFEAIRAEFRTASPARQQEILRITYRLQRDLSRRVFDVERPAGVPIHFHLSKLTDTVCGTEIVHQVILQDANYVCVAPVLKAGSTPTGESSVGYWGTGRYPGAIGMMAGVGMMPGTRPEAIDERASARSRPRPVTSPTEDTPPSPESVGSAMSRSGHTGP